MTTLAVAVFTKPLGLGVSKTRLAATLGAAASDRLAHGMVTAIADQLRVLQEARPGKVSALLCSWAGYEFRFTPTLSPLSLPNDLNLPSNLRRVTIHLKSRPADIYLLWPGDCPTVTLRVIDEALKLLAFADTVFVPSTDGGYCLMGYHAHLDVSAAFPPELGSEDALMASRQILSSVGLTSAVTAPLTDIDTVQDLADAMDRGLFAHSPTLACAAAAILADLGVLE